MRDKNSTSAQRKADIAAVKAAGFVGYDKTLHSKCGRPDYYGIMRVPDAEAAISKEAQKTPVNARKPEKRKLPYRIQGRLSVRQNDLLQRALKASTHKTVQEFISAAVMRYADEILSTKKAARCGNTERQATEEMSTL